jgi:hypothetical protein
MADVVVVVDSVGDKGAFLELMMGRNDDPANTASTTSSVAIPRSKAGSFIVRRVLSGFEDNRTVFVFLSRLVDTFLVVSLIFE